MASGKILVIVESPAKCSKIEEYLDTHISVWPVLDIYAN